MSIDDDHLDVQGLF